MTLVAEEPYPTAVAGTVANTTNTNTHLIKSKGAAHLLARRALKQSDLTQSLIAGYDLRRALSQLLVTQGSVGQDETSFSINAYVRVKR